MTYAYRDCRTIGHAWLYVPSDWTPTNGGVPMTTRCERCNLERRDTVGKNTGEVLGRRYTYPLGYLFDRADYPDRITPKRTDFRLLWIQDQIEKQRATRRARSKK